MLRDVEPPVERYSLTFTRFVSFPIAVAILAEKKTNPNQDQVQTTFKTDIGHGYIIIIRIQTASRYGCPFSCDASAQEFQLLDAIGKFALNSCISGQLVLFLCSQLTKHKTHASRTNGGKHSPAGFSYQSSSTHSPLPSHTDQLSNGQ